MMYQWLGSEMSYVGDVDDNRNRSMNKSMVNSTVQTCRSDVDDNENIEV